MWCVWRQWTPWIMAGGACLPSALAPHQPALSMSSVPARLLPTFGNFLPTLLPCAALLTTGAGSCLLPILSFAMILPHPHSVSTALPPSPCLLCPAAALPCLGRLVAAAGGWHGKGSPPTQLDAERWACCLSCHSCCWYACCALWSAAGLWGCRLLDALREPSVVAWEALRLVRVPAQPTGPASPEVVVGPRAQRGACPAEGPSKP